MELHIASSDSGTGFLISSLPQWDDNLLSGNIEGYIVNGSFPKLPIQVSHNQIKVHVGRRIHNHISEVSLETSI